MEDNVVGQRWNLIFSSASAPSPFRSRWETLRVAFTSIAVWLPRMKSSRMGIDVSGPLSLSLSPRGRGAREPNAGRGAREPNADVGEGNPQPGPRMDNETLTLVGLGRRLGHDVGLDGLLAGMVLNTTQ
jgi:hypothetical protein